jgi:hypothetical protein
MSGINKQIYTKKNTWDVSLVKAEDPVRKPCLSETKLLCEIGDGSDDEIWIWTCYVEKRTYAYGYAS